MSQDVRSDANKVIAHLSQRNAKLKDFVRRFSRLYDVWPLEAFAQLKTQAGQLLRAERFMRFTAKDISLQTGPGHSVGYECVLPESVRAELLREQQAKPIQPPPTPAIVAERKPPAWLTGLSAFAVMICPPMAMVAVLCGVIAAFGGLKSHPPPEMQRIAQDALTRIGSAQPVTQTPAVSAASNRSEPPPAPRVDLAGEWSAWFPAGAIPVWINGNIYQPGFVGPNAYFLQVSPTCTVSRAALIGRDPVVRRALPAAPRAELVSLAVRRATLVKP